MVFDEENRCRHYCDMRLERTAKETVARGCDSFTTTLLYSKYQKHELIRERAAFWVAQYGTRFYYEDFHTVLQQGIDESIRLGLYLQPYCGCIYSEQERYDKSLRKKRKN